MTGESPQAGDSGVPSTLELEVAARPHPHGNAAESRFERPRRHPRAGSPALSPNGHPGISWILAVFSSKRPIRDPKNQWALLSISVFQPIVPLSENLAMF